MAQDPNLDQENMEEQEEMTVTLTLDDGTEIECVVLTILRRANVITLLCFRWKVLRRKRERFTYTVIPSQRMDSRIWRISKMMMNMRS